MPTKVAAYAAQSNTSPVAPFSINRRDPGPQDIQIDILYCGVCHSDLHTARNEWQNTIYPVVPGHEIVGRITKVGKDVTKFTAGGLAGVGCLVDSRSEERRVGEGGAHGTCEGAVTDEASQYMT